MKYLSNRAWHGLVLASQAPARHRLTLQCSLFGMLASPPSHTTFAEFDRRHQFIRAIGSGGTLDPGRAASLREKGMGGHGVMVDVVDVMD
ncbi:hypothetical protein E4U25_006825, partial [Claviceps purpurea]